MKESVDDLTFDPDFTRAHQYFRGQVAYKPSPLREALHPGGSPLWLKDETSRMGLGAFKALGGPYAVARLIMEAWKSETGEDITPSRLKDADLRAFASRQSFVCASAGNHGLGVAAGAKELGAKARIYLAKTVPAGFDDRLKERGAEVVRAGETYDDSVAEAIADAERTGATLLADGTWQGYTEIPKLVMEGYTVIAEELRAEFEASGVWPTHVYLQAGVGGLAAAMAHMIRKNWSIQPELIVVEPEAALCLKASHDAGRPVRAEGPDSNMGRLDCKEPSIVAWQTLERCNVRYANLSEEEGELAAEAVTGLGLATTPSGAAGYGALCKDVETGRLDADARSLVIVSEGPA
ncbi:MAG: pyridoxal-phosphate dependent enzyme [Roseibium sp.]|uniref:pyridoxal-phosphate dependent enzyme n=1 Tax=Roseibium sp. TaxID=1936156 RepID=UPI002623770A|nr:pyridoxal-phosphate dependent enzyme [Roseibium sp.]MCV0428511.1 pyridoxal-phosphate dependent enzyme [Roseibium sp.]